MCNYVTYITKCRQCGGTQSSSQGDFVYCPLYRNGMGCQTIERDRRTILVLCPRCQNAYHLVPSFDGRKLDESGGRFSDSEDELPS
ncbi:hypothetical protein CCHL11_00268 [Colletotrichum chlorophyti]|uniref:Uncharacterized protein n=1 Tax=Colletotrichum chlorophyti TaxID=708187 RepID=A0A1Q8RV80_9PEZI|nr:hypothetical protein CCHL11_00268 [Colletotrichum chlorophyti]